MSARQRSNTERSISSKQSRRVATSSMLRLTARPRCSAAAGVLRGSNQRPGRVYADLRCVPVAGFLAAVSFADFLPAIGISISFCRPAPIASAAFHPFPRRRCRATLPKRELRAVAAGRKNWTFAGSDKGEPSRRCDLQFDRYCHAQQHRPASLARRRPSPPAGSPFQAHIGTGVRRTSLALLEPPSTVRQRCQMHTFEQAFRDASSPQLTWRRSIVVAVRCRLIRRNARSRSELKVDVFRDLAFATDESRAEVVFERPLHQRVLDKLGV